MNFYLLEKKLVFPYNQGMISDKLSIEFHCHTQYSPDSLSSVKDLLAVCDARGIDRIVITDHNTIQGALAAKEIDPVRVIVGEEIKTTGGELLAAFVQEEIPKGLSPMETIHRLKAQKAFISVSHPFDILRSGHLNADTRERARQHPL